MSTTTARKRPRKVIAPQAPLPLPAEPAPTERIVTRPGRRNLYAEIRHQGKLFRRSTGTRLRASAEQWLAIAKKVLARTGTLPRGCNVTRDQGGC